MIFIMFIIRLLTWYPRGAVNLVRPLGATGRGAGQGSRLAWDGGGRNNFLRPLPNCISFFILSVNPFHLWPCLAPFLFCIMPVSLDYLFLFRHFLFFSTPFPLPSAFLCILSSCFPYFLSMCLYILLLRPLSPSAETKIQAFNSLKISHCEMKMRNLLAKSSE